MPRALLFFGVVIAALVCIVPAATLRAAVSTMLPNGWHVSPAGSIAGLGTLPLHLAAAPGGRWLAVTTGGYGQLYISLVDERSGQVASSVPVDAAFYGLAFSGDHLFASAANGDTIDRFNVDQATGGLSPAGPLTLGRGDLWIAGLAADSSGTLFAAELDAGLVTAIDAATGKPLWTAPAGRAPYGVLLSQDGRTLFVSDWASAQVSVLDARSGKPLKQIGVGPHPNAELLSLDGKTLYVACANDDTVAVIDTASQSVRATLDANIYPAGLPGAMPNGLALSPDGRTLFVADAGDNAVVAIDLSARTPQVFGAVAVGWFPTDVAIVGNSMFVLDGKGVSGHANPRFSHIDALSYGTHSNRQYYDAALQTGDVEKIQIPDRDGLTAGLAAVRSNAAYTPSSSSHAALLPAHLHVIYVIKENRTYDETLGDDPRGNGDASLAIFGRRVTPNIHRLADDFVLLDNFDTDSTVSADGHNWSTAAYASDWVEKFWPPEYSRRRDTYDFEERGPASPQAGYLWNDAIAHSISIRDYGEFLKLGGNEPFQPSDPTLQGFVDPRFRGFDLRHSDQERIDEWLREFREYVSNGKLPQLEIVRLPNDHTAATRAGFKTPYAMVADNDYALGRLVEAVSHSRYWRDTVIISLEDDAQAGPDHVSDHRAQALIVGARIKRGFVDHTHYTTSGVLRTIELMLGLPPMSQWDAGATPLSADFTAKPDARPWNALSPTIDLQSVNSKKAPDAKASQSLELRDADEADPAQMTRILFDFVGRQESKRTRSHRPKDAPSH